MTKVKRGPYGNCCYCKKQFELGERKHRTLDGFACKECYDKNYMRH